MDLSRAITEPAVRLIDFHNSFNRNIKISFGALEVITSNDGIRDGELVSLPTGSEPWGRATRWRSLEGPVKDAASFLAEVGLVRATAAFEDYLTGAKAEFDIAGLRAHDAETTGSSALRKLDTVLGIPRQDIEDVVRMVEFFTVARNCVVHRSNRASEQLASLRSDPMLVDTVARWPKRVGKWVVTLPDVIEGEPVGWRPRHAIMASDAYYRCAIALDRKLVTLLDEDGLVRMAAHWTFFADPPVPCPAKLDAGTMVRTQIMRRYKVRSASLADVIASLRAAGKWDAALSAFNRFYPDGPETSLARKRRNRRRKQTKSRKNYG